MSLFDWKDGEYQYCADLVKAGGDKNCPREFVKSYLKLQRSDAERNLRDDVVEAFDTLIEKWVEILKEGN